jgi:drug/metabolite transporter (DMT)-like permease
VGAYIYLQPIFAAILSAIYQFDEFSVQKIIAAFLIFGGVFLVAFGKQLFKEKTFSIHK